MRAAATKGGSTTDAIEVTGLVKRFGSLVAVDGVSLSVQQGEVLALLGPNGAGKTTLARMIIGSLLPEKGEMVILGKRGGELGTMRRTHIGYCPQRLIVWKDLTCLEQLVFVADMYRIPRREGLSRARELLDWFKLTPKSNVPAAHLSGGMQRRLSLSLSMVHNPSILVLDEPEAGLDPQSRVLVRKRIRALSRERGKTVLVSTHDMDEAERVSDTVAIFDNGRLLVRDSAQTLTRNHGTARLIEIVLPALASERVVACCEALERIGLQVQRFDDVLVIGVDDDGTMVRPIRKVLADQDVVPLELRIRRRTLEDVFIDLTGRGLRDA